MLMSWMDDDGRELSLTFGVSEARNGSAHHVERGGALEMTPSYEAYPLWL